MTRLEIKNTLEDLIYVADIINDLRKVFNEYQINE